MTEENAQPSITLICYDEHGKRSSETLPVAAVDVRHCSDEYAVSEWVIFLADGSGRKLVIPAHPESCFDLHAIPVKVMYPSDSAILDAARHGHFDWIACPARAMADLLLSEDELARKKAARAPSLDKIKERARDARLLFADGKEFHRAGYPRFLPLSLTDRQRLKELEIPSPQRTETRHEHKTTQPNEHVFCRMGDEGDYWQIVFEGRELPPVRHRKGLTYLHALLARPGDFFPALDLYEKENPPASVGDADYEGGEMRRQHGTGGKSVRHMDIETRKAVNKRIAELREEMKCPELGWIEKGEREKELRKLENHLATGGAVFEPTEKRQPRQAVCAAISRAVDAIAEQEGGGNLAKHLCSTRDGGTIEMGKQLSYVGGLNWQT